MWGITDLAVFDDGSGPALYVAGAFTHAGDVVVNGVAKLSGSEWAALGGGLFRNSGSAAVASALAADDRGPGASALYVAGTFDLAGGVAAPNIARWTGAAWEPLADGLPRPVSALRFYDTDGRGPALRSLFAAEGYASGSRILRWNGQGWADPAALAQFPGSSFQPYVTRMGITLAAGGEEVLIAAGEFGSVGSVPAAGLAAYGGCQGCPADYGRDGVVNSNDISAFLQGWLAALSGQPVDADFNRDGVVNSNDISAFLAEWLAAVAGGC